MFFCFLYNSMTFDAQQSQEAHRRPAGLFYHIRVRKSIKRDGSLFLLSSEISPLANRAGKHHNKGNMKLKQGKKGAKNGF